MPGPPRTSAAAPGPLAGRSAPVGGAGVVGQDLAEVVDAGGGRAADGGVRQPQQGAVLGVAPEVVAGEAGDVVADRPEAAAAGPLVEPRAQEAQGVEGVEVRRGAVVGPRDQG